MTATLRNGLVEALGGESGIAAYERMADSIAERLEWSLGQALHEVECADHPDSQGCRFGHRMKARRLLGFDAGETA